MPSENRLSRKSYATYDLMSNEALEAILRRDVFAIGDEALDTDEVIYITEVLAQRKKNSENPGKSPEEAFAAFRDKYMNADSAAEDWDEASITAPTTVEIRRSGCFGTPGWMRHGAAAAAAVAFVLIGSLTARSFAFDKWEGLYQSTEDIFHMTGSLPVTDGFQDPTLDLEDYEYDDLLTQYGFPIHVVPTRLPEGFVQTSHRVDAVGMKTILTIDFESEDCYMGWVVSTFNDNSSMLYPKDDELFMVREINGTPYFVFSNLDYINVVWRYGNVEYNIGGNLTMDEVNKMLDSIGG